MKWDIKNLIIIIIPYELGHSQNAYFEIMFEKLQK